MNTPHDSPPSLPPSAPLNWRAAAFVGVIAGMLLAIIFGLGLSEYEYDSQEYWTHFEQNCPPEICYSPVFEQHLPTLQLMAQDINAVDQQAKGQMLAAIRCAQDLQRREQLIANGVVDETDAVARRLTREQSASCKAADARLTR